MNKIFLKKLKNVSVGNLIITGSIFNNYCGGGCLKGKDKNEIKAKKYSGNDSKNNETKSTEHITNDEQQKGNDDQLKNKGDDDNNKSLSGEDLLKQANDVNKTNDELEKIKAEIKNKIEDLKNLKETDISAKFDSIKDKEFFNKCKKILDIIKDSDYLNNKSECFSTFPSEYDCLIETHQKLSSDINYYNKYIDVLKIYAYYFYFLKDLHNLKSKIDGKVKKLEEDNKKLDDSIFEKELDETLKKINENLNYYYFRHENSLDKIIANAQKKVDESDAKIKKIKEKLTTALSSVKTSLESKKTNIENKIKTIEGEITAIEKIIENNKKIIKTSVGESSTGDDVNYQNINKKITEILKKIPNTDQFIYIDSYKDNTALINKFNSLKTEIIKYIKSDIKFCKSQIDWYNEQIEEHKNKKDFDNKWYYEQISEYSKRIDKSNNKINEFETKLANKINEKINKKNIEKESQVIFHIGIDGEINVKILDKMDNKTYDLEKIPHILSELQSLFSLVNICFLSNYYVYNCKYFNYSPEREENEKEDSYKKRVEDIKNKVNFYFEKLEIDYKELNKDKSDFVSKIATLKTESENALKAIEKFFVKKGENEYYKEFDEKRKIYIEIIEGLGTQYYALKDFYDKKLEEITKSNSAIAKNVNDAEKNIYDNQYKLSEKQIESEKENNILQRIENSLNNLDDCSKNIIVEDTTTGEKKVNSNFSDIYYFSTGDHFKYDDDHFINFITYNNNIAIVKSLNANKDEIEKAVAKKNESVNRAKEIKDKNNKIIFKYRSFSFYNSDIESPFSKIVYEKNKDYSYKEDKIKMYFEKTILTGVKGLIERKNNNNCNSDCKNSKNCYNNLRDFLTNSKLEETYNSIVTEWKNSINDSGSYPSFSKDF